MIRNSIPPLTTLVASPLRSDTWNHTPVLVVSCDRYADLWDPLFRILRLRWPDCPFPIYLGANHKSYEGGDVTTITIGDDESWASGVREMIGRLDTSYVIMLLEDFFLTQTVDTALIQELVDVARREQLGCLRLVGELPLAYPPTRPIAGRETLGEIPKRTAYRVTAQAAIWRVDTLMKLLVPGANAWEFEELGTALSNRLSESFWGVWRNAIHYEQVVEKGMWKPVGLRICAEAGVAIDQAARGVYSAEALAAHYDRSKDGAEDGEMRRAALNAFSRGHRIDGLRWTVRSTGLRPASLRLWASAAWGLAGPAAISWLESTHLDRRVAEIRRRVRKG